MPQVVNTGKRENDYSVGMQMLSLSAERQSKKNQRQAILKNIIRSQGLNADISEDGEIVFNDKKGENRISTQEAMNIGKVSTPESNLTRESEYNVKSEVNTDLTSDLVNMADQARQNNQDSQAQADTKQAMRDRLGSIMTNQFPPLNRTTSDSGDDSNNTNPNTSTITSNTVPTTDNQWNSLIPPKIEQNPKPPMDYPKPVSPRPVVPPSPPPNFKSNKDVKSQKDTYQTGYSTDRGVDVEIDPVVTTEGYKVQGMRDEVQEDMRDLQRKATIFSALNGLDPNAHNPYAEMAKQRSTDLDFYNKNMVGVRQNMASATGGIKYKGANKEDIKMAEGAQTQIENRTTVDNRAPGYNPNAKDEIYSVQGADGNPYDLEVLGGDRMGVMSVINPQFFFNMNDFNSNFVNTLFKQNQKDEIKRAINNGGNGTWTDNKGSVIKIEQGMLVKGTVFTTSMTNGMDRMNQRLQKTGSKSASDPNQLNKTRQAIATGTLITK